MEDTYCSCGHLRSHHRQGIGEHTAVLEDGPCEDCPCPTFRSNAIAMMSGRGVLALEQLADAAKRIADVLERFEGDGVAVRR